MKTLFLIAIVSMLGTNVKASVYENNCITFQEAMSESMTLPSNVSEEALPQLDTGWKWVKVYRQSRDGSYQETHWMSWPDGQTLGLCQ